RFIEKLTIAQRAVYSSDFSLNSCTSVFFHGKAVIHSGGGGARSVVWNENAKNTVYWLKYTSPSITGVEVISCPLGVSTRVKPNRAYPCCREALYSANSGIEIGINVPWVAGIPTNDWA